MKRNKYGLPNHHFIKDGGVDPSRIAMIQRLQTKEGTDVYKRYEKYWKEVEGLGDKPTRTVPMDRDVLSNTQEQNNNLQRYASVSGTINVVSNGARRNENKEQEDVWIGIKIDEEHSYYTLQDIYGRSINRKEFIQMKMDKEIYEEFEYKCWSEFVEKEINGKEELYLEISNLLEIPLDRVNGARVDSEYDEEVGDIIISFKARVKRGAWT